MNAAASCAFDATLPSIARRARYAPCTPHTAHYTRTAPQVDIIQSSTNGYAHHGMAHALGHATTPWQGPPNAPSSVQSSGQAGVVSDYVRPPVLPHSANVRHCTAQGCCTSHPALLHAYMRRDLEVAEKV